ncbi:lipoprotein LprG [Marmoricola sp. OAE513]|uniref:LppX_LprAFG lipoprotein n=1 Tax=Marmoricola sp. OAE513 TaxID=2817894 RepID=UPI001AE4A71B
MTLKALGATVLVAMLALTGCGGDDSSGGGKPVDAKTALAGAKKSFDDASGVHFTMSTKATPKGDAVLGADGSLTDQPAFDGKVKVVYKGFAAEIPVVSVDGDVYAKLPFSAAFAKIDPAEFSAPDPADFIDPSKGISGILLELGDAKQTDRTREGKDIVTTYTGTVSGERVAGIIPSASKDSDYQAVIGIADDTIVTLSITGDFFDGEDAATFKLVFDKYGEVGKIKKP